MQTDHIRTLKILLSRSEFRGLSKQQYSQACTKSVSLRHVEAGLMRKKKKKKNTTEFVSVIISTGIHAGVSKISRATEGSK